jgi:hypothetical protein
MAGSGSISTPSVNVNTSSSYSNISSSIQGITDSIMGVGSISDSLSGFGGINFSHEINFMVDIGWSNNGSGDISVRNFADGLIQDNLLDFDSLSDKAFDTLGTFGTKNIGDFNPMSGASFPDVWHSGDGFTYKIDDFDSDGVYDARYKYEDGISQTYYSSGLGGNRNSGVMFEYKDSSMIGVYTFTEDGYSLRTEVGGLFYNSTDTYFKGKELGFFGDLGYKNFGIEGAKIGQTIDFAVAITSFALSSYMFLNSTVGILQALKMGTLSNFQALLGIMSSGLNVWASFDNLDKQASVYASMIDTGGYGVDLQVIALLSHGLNININYGGFDFRFDGLTSDLNKVNYNYYYGAIQQMKMLRKVSLITRSNVISSFDVYEQMAGGSIYNGIEAGGELYHPMSKATKMVCAGDSFSLGATASISLFGSERLESMNNTLPLKDKDSKNQGDTLNFTGKKLRAIKELNKLTDQFNKEVQELKDSQAEYLNLVDKLEDLYNSHAQSIDTALKNAEIYKDAYNENIEWVKEQQEKINRNNELHNKRVDKYKEEYETSKELIDVIKWNSGNSNLQLLANTMATYDRINITEFINGLVDTTVQGDGKDSVLKTSILNSDYKLKALNWMADKYNQSHGTSIGFSKGQNIFSIGDIGEYLDSSKKNIEEANSRIIAKVESTLDTNSTYQDKYNEWINKANSYAGKVEDTNEQIRINEEKYIKAYDKYLDLVDSYTPKLSEMQKTIEKMGKTSSAVNI